MKEWEKNKRIARTLLGFAAIATGIANIIAIHATKDEEADKTEELNNRVTQFFDGLTKEFEKRYPAK